jgi:transcriptional regulator with AAA-type ATPase domain
MLGICPAVHQVYKAIGLVAAQWFSVIIAGDSGTGKELVAPAIHEETEEHTHEGDPRGRRSSGNAPMWRDPFVIRGIVVRS